MYTRLSIALGTLCVCALTSAPVQAAGAESGKKTLTDRYGDPLPEGARLRLGTLRFHYPQSLVARPSMAFVDNKTVVSLHHSGVIIHWDPLTGKHLRHIRAPNTDSALTPALSTNGRVAAFRLYPEKAISIRDTTSGRELRRIPRGDLDWPYLSPDGSLVASWDSSAGLPYESLLIWEVGSNKAARRLKCPTSMHSANVYVPSSVHFSADGKRAFYVSKEAFLYDAATGEQKLHLQPQAGTSYQTIAMSFDGKMLALVEQPKDFPSVLVVLDARTGKEVKRMELAQPVSQLAFSRDGTLLALELFQSVALLDTRTWDVVRALKTASYGLSLPLALSPDGKMLARPGMDQNTGVLQIWETGTGNDLTRVPSPSGEPLSMVFAPDGKTLLSQHQFASGFFRWDTGTGQQLSSVGGIRKLESPICFVNDGSLLAPGPFCLTRWDATADKLLAKFPYTPPRTAKERDMERENMDLIASTPNGSLFFARTITTEERGLNANNGDDQHIRLTIRAWDAQTGKLAVEYHPRPGYRQGDDRFSPDAKHFLSSEGELYDASTGRRLLSLEGPAPVQCGAYSFSANAASAAALAYRGVSSRSANGVVYRGLDVRAWELATGSPILDFRCPDSGTDCVALAPNGRVVATADSEVIRLLDVTTGKQVWEGRGHDSPVKTLVFSPDGRTLASGLADSTILFWDVARAVIAAPHRLSPREMEPLWSDLGQSDPRKGQAAVQELVRAGEDAISFLKDRVKPAEELSAKQIQELIAGLDSQSFQTRQNAGRELELVSELAEPALRAALKGKVSPEAAARMTELLKSPGKVRSPSALRAVRAIQVLELVGSEQAKDLVATLAGGAPTARETREAKAALQRLSNSPK